MTKKLYALVTKLRLLPGQIQVVTEEYRIKGYDAAAYLALTYSRTNRKKTPKGGDQIY